MNWLKHHKTSETLAQRAETARRKSQDMYKEAALFEEKALADVDAKDKRTLGILAVSAACLYHKAGQNRCAESIVIKWAPQVPEFAARQLRELQHVIWQENLLADRFTV
jgi:hypothetical protein